MECFARRVRSSSRKRQISCRPNRNLHVIILERRTKETGYTWKDWMRIEGDRDVHGKWFVDEQ